MKENTLSNFIVLFLTNKTRAMLQFLWHILLLQNDSDLAIWYCWFQEVEFVYVLNSMFSDGIEWLLAILSPLSM
jgi:hypothetical protein